METTVLLLDVQDFGFECPDSGLLSVGALLGRGQVLGRASNSSRSTSGCMFSIHFTIKGN